MTSAPTAAAHWQSSRPTPPGCAHRQHGLAGLHAAQPAQQVVDGEAPADDGRGGRVVDVARNRDQPARRDIADRAPCARQVGIGQPVAGPDALDARAHRFDRAGRRHAGNEGVALFRRLQAAAVEAHGGLAQLRLAGAGRPDGFLLDDRSRAAGPDADDRHHALAGRICSGTVSPNSFAAFRPRIFARSASSSPPIVRSMASPECGHVPSWWG